MVRAVFACDANLVSMYRLVSYANRRKIGVNLWNELATLTNGGVWNVRVLPAAILNAKAYLLLQENQYRYQITCGLIREMKYWTFDAWLVEKSGNADNAPNISYRRSFQQVAASILLWYKRPLLKSSDRKKVTTPRSQPCCLLFVVCCLFMTAGGARPPEAQECFCRHGVANSVWKFH